MKKLFTICLLVICTLCFSSCFLSGSPIIPCSHMYSPATCISPQVCTKCGKTTGTALGHSFNDATCTEPKTCSRCDQTSGTALGHTTTNGTCSRCGKDFGNWVIKYYVDEFNEYTDIKYITTSSDIVGTFSNSATTNSLLKARFLIDAENVAIKLFEYGSSTVKSYYTATYKITMKDTAGTKHTIYGVMYDGGDRVNIKEEYEELVINTLKKPGTVSFYLVESKYTTSTYLFTVNTGNFSTLYNQL